MNDECGGDLACEMSIRFETKGTWCKYGTRPQTQWGGDDQRYGFEMWLVWGLNFKGWYGIGKYNLIFSYCWFMNVGPCQRVIPWGL